MSAMWLPRAASAQSMVTGRCGEMTTFPEGSRHGKALDPPTTGRECRGRRRAHGVPASGGRRSCASVAAADPEAGRTNEADQALESGSVRAQEEESDGIPGGPSEEAEAIAKGSRLLRRLLQTCS